MLEQKRGAAAVESVPSSFQPGVIKKFKYQVNYAS